MIQLNLLTYVPSEQERAPPPTPAPEPDRSTVQSPLWDYLNGQLSYYRQLQLKIMGNSTRDALAGNPDPARQALRRWMVADLQAKVDGVLERLRELEEERDRL
jgi:hypothetical protein